MNNLTDNDIELMGNIYNQITSKIDMDKPFPQDIEVEFKVNLICEKPRSGFCVTIPHDET